MSTLKVSESCVSSCFFNLSNSFILTLSRLVDFFRYFSHDFQFNNSVLSLRAGQLTKESKGWVNDIDVGGLNEMARDRNRLCIEVSASVISRGN